MKLVLEFTRATRSGDWELHLSCIKAFLPWFFVYDHLNYARYGSIYYCHMDQLKETHPEAFDVFSKGDFVVQRSESSRFSQVAVDQTIEQTVNRNTKSTGGVVEFSTKQGASQHTTVQVLPVSVTRKQESLAKRVWHTKN